MVKIITDTTSGLPAAVAQHYDIPVIPQVIHFGEESYLDGVEMDNAQFMRRLNQCLEMHQALPKSAAPPPDLFVKALRKLVPLGEPILCIHPSSDLSGTVRSATAAKAEFPDADIRVIDTRVVGSPLCTLVTLAAEWAAAGLDVDTIVDHLTGMISRCHAYFTVATMDYLARSGRIPKAVAVVADFVQIKPILTLREGNIELLERARTQKRALARMKELVYEKIARDGTGYLSVMHAAVPEQARLLADEMCAQLQLQAVPVVEASPVVVVHSGPGTIAIAFFSQS